MEVLELRDLSRRETHLHYRRAFSAVARLASGARAEHEARIEFVLEHLPLGPISVTVRLVDDVDYPRVPVIAALKRHIQELEREGALP